MNENTQHDRNAQEERWGNGLAWEVLEALGHGVTILDKNGRFAYVNPVYTQMVGRSQEELHALTPHDVIHPDDHAPMHLARQQTLSDEPSTYEARLIRPDNTILHARITVISHKQQGKVVGAVSIVTDLTRHKLDEISLQQSRAQFVGIIDSAMDAIISLDEAQNVVLFNTAAEQMFGHAASEVIGQPLDRLIPERFRSKHGQHVKRFGEAGTTNRKMGHLDTLWALRANGQEFPIEASISQVETGGQKLYTVILRDITERKSAEESLRQSKTELQHVIDTVPEGVLLLDAAGLLRLTNPLADDYLALLAPNRENGRLTTLGKRPLLEFLTSPPTKGLWHEIALDDHVFELIARPVEIGPFTSGWVLVIRDVTQERDIQQRIQRQERLAAVGQLAAGVAHDFNNIMAVIVLYAQILYRIENLSLSAQERLNTIEQQAKRAIDLIQQILDFSRQSVMERKPVDLLPFIRELIKLFERTLPENIQIELEHNEDAYMILADISRIQQILMNLAVNARDAMPEGGQLQIRLARVQTAASQSLQIGELPPGNWIQIQVADRGSGIAEKDLAFIFEPFFTTKEVGQGTGLGLAQVYGIVQQHDGFIDVASGAEAGTTFTLYFLELVSEGEMVRSPDNAFVQPGQGQTILVVEDSAATRQALVDSLKLLNYQVIEAENGRIALSVLAARAAEIDLVLSDAVMPEIGGVALLYAARQQKYTMPFVLLTGHPLSKEMQNIQATGFAGWLIKPPDLISLSQLVAEALTT